MMVSLIDSTGRCTVTALRADAPAPLVAVDAAAVRLGVSVETVRREAV